MALQVQIVIEILGRPAEHVKKAIDVVLERLDAEKGVTILGKTIHDPVLTKDSKDLYTAFAEVDLELKSIENYFALVFAYMPSHIELISPKEINISNFDLSEIANRLTQRLHSYDAITKKIIIERNILLSKLKEVAPQLFKKEMKRQDEEKKRLKKEMKRQTKKKPTKKAKKTKKKSKKSR
jgi:hypothetical protein